MFLCFAFLMLLVHSEKTSSDCSHIEGNMIAATVFVLITNQTEFCWVYNQEENCHHDHIPFNLKVITKKLKRDLKVIIKRFVRVSDPD